MAGFNGTVLTTKGRNLQAKAQIGTALNFTKVKLGSGALANGQSLESLNDLITPVMTLTIQGMTTNSDGTSKITVLVTNNGLETGFYVREIGLYATDPQLGEILYSVSNAGTLADYLPAGGGAVVVEQLFELITIVGNATNVTAVIDTSLALATKKEVADYFDDPNGHDHSGIDGKGPKLHAENTLINAIAGLTGITDTQGALEGILAEALKNSPTTMRNIVLKGPYTTKGIASLLRDRYSENLCYGGASVSGGDYAGYHKDSTFDGLAATSWASSQVYTAVSGAAYIGYDFGASVTKHIRRVAITCNTGIGTPASVKIQRSADGADWTDVGTSALYHGKNVIDLAASAAYRFWRVLANANLAAATSWTVHEIEMYELTDAALALNDIVIQAGGVITFAAGFGTIGQVDYLYAVAANMTLSGLAAADDQTIPLVYTDDLCNGGTAISGGALAGHLAEAAFDNNPSTYFGGTQTGATISGVSYIGYNLATAKAIRKIVLTHYTDPNAVVPSGKVQYSDNGTVWADAVTVALVGGVNNISVPYVGSHSYWRILANANLVGGYGWGVTEVEMCEALQTHYIYATRDTDGSVTYGSTRQKPKSGKPSQSVTTSVGTYTGNICTGGNAISSGDLGSDYASNAFDGNPATGWSSAQTTGGQLGVSYIGYHFTTSKVIRRIQYKNSPNAPQIVASLKVQRSTDGVTWSDVSVHTPNLAASAVVTLDVPVAATAPYWRMLANSNTAPYAWVIIDIEMMEYIDPITTVSADDLIYTDNIAVGCVAIASGETAGSPKQNAFDGSTSTLWASEISTAYTARYIGCDFGVARHIRRLTFYGDLFATSAKIQRSTDGTTWNDVKTVAVSAGLNTVILDASTASRYWRILGNSTTRVDGVTAVASALSVSEITMHEICTDLNHYDAYEGISRHYDGNTWTNVVRKFLGEVVVDSAGKIVGVTTYPYGIAKLKALPGEESDDVVTLGQFANFLSGNGWQQLPGGLVLQWGLKTVSVAAETVVLPIKYSSFYVVSTTVRSAGSGFAGDASEVNGTLRTLTQFAIGITNNSGSATTGEVQWIAIGK